MAALAAILAFVGQNRLTADEPVLTSGNLTVRFDEKDRTIEVSDKQAGTILRSGTIIARVDGRVVPSRNFDLTYSATRDIAKGALILEFKNAFTARLSISQPDQLDISVEGKLDGPASFEGAMPMPDAMIAILDDERERDRGVLVTTLGQANVPTARSLFDPQRDLAVSAVGANSLRWNKNTKAWLLDSEASSGANLLSLRVRHHYYRDHLKIAYYAPITKRKRWQTAPVVAMTWYGIQGWKGTPAQTKEWLYPNIDWVAKHLLPYAETLVFQLDDNYYTDNDKYMRDIADYIRSKGLVPGIWFTPYTVAPPEVTGQHPDWFIHDKDGKPIKTFGGVSYRDHLTLNANNREAVREWFGMWWRKASATWNFDFFKIDGQPQVIDAYRKSADGGGVEGYRKGLAIGRQIVGDEKFINVCWGIPLEAIGLVDGSRTGGDTGNQAHAIDIILRWNFLNNVAWWSDPDAAANLYRATVERTRLNAQARVLTGQQFLTDDVWTSVPPQICRVWQRSFPTLDIRPVNLYKIDDWKQYDLFDLRIAKPWGTWDVVGLFNYEGRPTTKSLDLERLPLEADEVHVFDYWNSVYLGKFRRDAKIMRALAAHEGELFSIVPAPKDDRPVLLSTSRHLSQGGLDLDELSAIGGRTSTQDIVGPDYSSVHWSLAGKSSHLIAGEPYELVFATGNYDRVPADSFFGAGRMPGKNGVSRVTLVPKKGGSEQWEVDFEEIHQPSLDVVPAVSKLRPGMTGEIQILSKGPNGFQWQARASDPRIRLSQSQGTLEGRPAQAKVTVSINASGLPPGKTWKGKVVVTAEGLKEQQSEVEVWLDVPPPENLALQAKARASSFWGKGHEAKCVNDGETTTRWNSGKQEKESCWIELAWDKPVSFDRVVIDEVLEFGARIDSWKLEAGIDKMEAIARGDQMGQTRTINLQKPIGAKKLRLTIGKASQTPTIREIEVYRSEKR